MSMMNILEINGQKALISYDPDTNMLRGEFLGLAGGADFYGVSIKELFEEGARSLETFLEVCRERGIEPYRHFSGKLQLRLDQSLHERAAVAAASRGQSLNALIEHAVEHELNHCT